MGGYFMCKLTLSVSLHTVSCKTCFVFLTLMRTKIKPRYFNRKTYNNYLKLFLSNNTSNFEVQFGQVKHIFKLSDKK